MKLNKTHLAALGVLALAGITDVVLFNQKTGDGKEADGPAGSNRSAASTSPSAGGADDGSGKSGERSRTRQAPTNSDLVAKYGEARTNLSKHVSTNIAGLPKMELEKLDSSIESARKITSGIRTMMDGLGGLRDAMPTPPEPAGQ